MKIFLKSIISCSCIFLIGCATGRNLSLTVQDPIGNINIEPYPKTPNCVSSIEPITNKHYIPPLGYSGEKEFAYRKLVIMIESDPRARIVAKQASYLRVEFRSAIFGFVDDVEFLFSSEQSVIEVRSASRVGYYDFGKNRRRIEDIRKRWDKSPNPSWQRK